MKKFLVLAMLSAFVVVAPLSVGAQVSVGVNIGVPLPPPLVVPAPPAVVVLPGALDVYVAPDIAVDLFFYNGWWWRPWGGRWYRSRYYDRGWGFFNHVPRFYAGVDPGWRGFYASHNWHGQPWNFQRISNSQLQHNWKGWHDSGYWNQRGYGVKGYKPQPQQRAALQRGPQGRPEVRGQPNRQPQAGYAQPRGGEREGRGERREEERR